MDELAQLCERLRTQRPVAWEQLPDFPLYMDQVLSYMDRQVLRFEDDDGLTAAMVNNYTKSGLVPRAEGKKYNQEHLAYLTAICILKRVMSARDMDVTLTAELQQQPGIEEGYTLFRDSLDQALNFIADEDKRREAKSREQYLADKGKMHPIKKRDKYRRFRIKTEDSQPAVSEPEETRPAPNLLGIPEEKRKLAGTWLLLCVIPFYLIFILDWIFLKFFAGI